MTTLGYGDLFASGEDQYYTSTFSGTSSASPIVTGASISLLGVFHARGPNGQNARTIRHLLASTGTAQATDARHIGPQPDLRRAIQNQPGFSWSDSGPIAGRHCVKWSEGADPHTWNDNYLCY
ncbi:hypothetical protein ACLESO_41970 [Pyxidicoccus sp. 3LG]